MFNLMLIFLITHQYITHGLSIFPEGFEENEVSYFESNHFSFKRN